MATNPSSTLSSEPRNQGDHYGDVWQKSNQPVFGVMPLAEYKNLRVTASNLILGATVFTTTPDSPAELPPFEVVSTLAPLESDSWVELYRFPEGAVTPVITRRGEAEFRLSHTEDYAFGHWETELPFPDSIEETTRRAYCTILEAIRELGGFHLWRCWNVIPDIHAKVGELDHYMQFCLGRYEALLKDGNVKPESLPAASAVGSRGNRMQISFIAGKEAGKTFENPDQISAYTYPKQYGPASPSFSRSLFAGDHLWLSGTASIAGHETLHGANLPGQVHETASRIETLIASVASQRRSVIDPPKNVKIFLRHRESARELMPLLESVFSNKTTYHLVEADICRDDLLIEIEGVTP